MKRFSPTTKEVLGYYVYVSSDPDTGEVFYVGKGHGNRVFSHLKNKKESDKTKKIAEIRKRGKEPIIEILAHGLDEETALKVESAAIDLIGIDNLTNIKRGFDSKLYGVIEASLLDARHSREELREEDITENIILIRINNTYRYNMSELELYEATRGYWVLNPEKASKAKYAMPVYDGVILEVYKIATWLPSGSTFMDTRKCEKIAGRYEFVGKLASKKIREKYINKSVTNLFAYGNLNPIKYEGKAFR